MEKKQTERTNTTRSSTTEFRLDFARHGWSEIGEYLHPCKAYKKNGGAEYLNVSASFDIEVTSFFRHRETMRIIDTMEAESIPEAELRKKWEKCAIMYAWVFTYDGHAFVGRTWDEYARLSRIVQQYHGLSRDRFLVVGVHNLAYEFQFMRNRFDWIDVFATSERTPIYARSTMGFEYRCTLILSGYSLAKVSEHLLKYQVRKMVGDLDYIKLRHSKTPLTETEWGYIVNDGLVVSAYIQELIEQNRRITWIPYTKTGFVRKHLKKRCFYSKASHKRDGERKFQRYRQLMMASTIETPEEYELLHQSFTGAIVHCNAYHSGKIMEGILSMDETSAYPTQLAIGYFPFGKGKWVKPKSKEELDRYISKKSCFMDVTFNNIERTQTFESIISRNKCTFADGFMEDNGRLMSAKSIRICITEIDYLTFRKFYKWDSMRIHRMIVYSKRRLPTDFVNAVLELYAKKTELKGVEGMEAEYMHAKESINSVYGACVTNICNPKVRYIGGQWITEPCDVMKELERYNKSKNRFNCYQWGVVVTSLARRALASAIYSLGDDYVYSDTDSVKFRNPERHKAFFERYNEWMMGELRKASEYHQIPLERFMPKSKDGKEHPLGIWEFDGMYRRFKSLGAKRYAVEYEDGHHSLTIAGVNKGCAIPYIEAHERDFFDFMRFGYTFNEDACGKRLHTYIDDPREGELMDYLGNVAPFFEYSCIHMMRTTYEMTASDEYQHLLDCIVSSYTIG